jgi:hypothetical protein
MPDIVAQNHDVIIQRMIREGRPKIIRKYRSAVAKAKNGYLFPIKIYVNYFFGIQNDFCFSGLLIK